MTIVSNLCSLWSLSYLNIHKPPTQWHSEADIHCFSLGSLFQQEHPHFQGAPLPALKHDLGEMVPGKILWNIGLTNHILQFIIIGWAWTWDPSQATPSQRDWIPGPLFHWEEKSSSLQVVRNKLRDAHNHHAIERTSHTENGSNRGKHSWQMKKIRDRSFRSLDIAVPESIRVSVMTANQFLSTFP